MTPQEITELFAREMDKAPILNSMFRVATACKLDSISMVRRPSAERPAGIAVLLIGNVAIQSIGPILNDTAKRVHMPTASQIDMDGDSHLTRVFECMDEAQVPWMFSKFNAKRLPCIFAVFRGDCCGMLALELTALGCPTKLA